MSTAYYIELRKYKNTNNSFCKPRYSVDLYTIGFQSYSRLVNLMLSLFSVNNKVLGDIWRANKIPIAFFMARLDISKSIKLQKYSEPEGNVRISICQ